MRAGNVSTAFNGGFASVRSQGWGGFSPLARARGLRLLVKGDGLTYKMNAKTDDAYDGVTYQRVRCPIHNCMASRHPAAAAPLFPLPLAAIHVRPTSRLLLRHRQDFRPQPRDEWTTVDMTWAEFKPTFRGQLVRGAPPLRGAQVRQLGLMVSKFSDTGGTTANFAPGGFRLALRAVRGLV